MMSGFGRLFSMVVFFGAFFANKLTNKVGVVELVRQFEVSKMINYFKDALMTSASWLNSHWVLALSKCENLLDKYGEFFIRY